MTTINTSTSASPPVLKRSADEAALTNSTQKHKEYLEIIKCLAAIEEARKAEQEVLASINKLHEKLKKSGFTLKIAKKLRKLYNSVVEKTKTQETLISHVMTCIQRYNSGSQSVDDDELRRKKHKPEETPQKSTPAASDTEVRLTPGKHVIAQVEKDGSLMFMLAIVRKLFTDSPPQYLVEDADVEEEATQDRRYILPKDKLIPIIGNVEKHKIIPPKSVVLALYPDTSCFYRATIIESASKPVYEYTVEFEDDNGQYRKVAAQNVVPYS